MFPIQLTLTVTSAAQLLALASLAEGKIAEPAPKANGPASTGASAGATPAAAPARSSRTATAASTPAAAAATKSTDSPALPPSTGKDATASSADDTVTPAMVTARVLKFTADAEHKKLAIGILNKFKQADGSVVTAGRYLQDADRPAAYAQLGELATELGLED